MAQTIREVLNRRDDLSTFVVHLTRARDGISAKDRLTTIINDRQIIAGSPMGWAADQDDPADATKQTQRVVCFSETPLQHIYSLVADIEGRQVKLEPYGVAMTKMSARRLGINPVWYVDMTPGRDWVISPALNTLKNAATATGAFHEQPIARLLPFFEPMGTWPQRQREFWWEREWRHVGDVALPDPLVGILILCPEDEIDDFQALSGQTHRMCLDPRWGLEQIIAHLAQVPVDQITPFAPGHADDDVTHPGADAPF